MKNVNTVICESYRISQESIAIMSYLETVIRPGTGPIQSHSWSPDRSHVAVANGGKDVHIYNNSQNVWKEVGNLSQHDLTVTSIDWAPRSNMIVTCSQDRNAYVWVPEGNGEWRYTLVLLRINRAATCVKWSPAENKFAVGSGARIISICYYDKDNDWWVAKHIKKPLRSTITCLDWHQNNVLLAAGSTDYKVRVFSAYVKDIEPKPSATKWGAKMPFAQLMAEFSNSDTGGGWVHSVQFSDDGASVAWVAHDSSITVASSSCGVKKMRTNLLPLLSLIWISPSCLLAGGHDCVPVIFHIKDSDIVMGDMLESSSTTVEEVAPVAAMKIFRSKDRTGETSSSNYSLSTTHQSHITQLNIVTGDKSNASLVSSSGADGRICVWKFDFITDQIKKLSI